MSNFVTALIRQRREAKKAAPDTNGRLKEIRITRVDVRL